MVLSLSKIEYKTINASKDTLPTTAFEHKHYIKPSYENASLAEGVSSSDDYHKFYHEGSIKDYYTITDIVLGKGSYATVKLGFVVR